MFISFFPKLENKNKIRIFVSWFWPQMPKPNIQQSNMCLRCEAGCLSSSLFIHPSVHLSVSPSVYSSIHSSVYLHPSVCPSISIRPSACLSCLMEKCTVYGRQECECQSQGCISALVLYWSNTLTALKVLDWTHSIWKCYCLHNFSPFSPFPGHFSCAFHISNSNMKLWIRTVETAYAR